MSLRHLSIAVIVVWVSLLTACAQAMLPGTDELVAPVALQKTGANTGVHLAVQELGKGKPIVLLHGLGASSYTWRHILPELAKTNHVIAIDLKGFGKSDKPLDEHYSIFDQAQLIANYLREKDLRGVVLIGHSFGGGVALATAISDVDTKSKRIERLVLIDSIAYRQPMPLFFQILRTPLLGEIGMALIPPEVQISRALSIAYYDGWKVEDETIRRYAESLQSEGGRHALLHTINSLEPEHADEISSRYHELKQPTLLLWCEHDRIVPLKFGKRLAGDLQNSRIHFILNCGHIPQEEQPTETLRSIQQFIQ
jgi:pimeloyl-ACP methyl ester carboxylesterase